MASAVSRATQAVGTTQTVGTTTAGRVSPAFPVAAVVEAVALEVEAGVLVVAAGDLLARAEFAIHEPARPTH